MSDASNSTLTYLLSSTSYSLAYTLPLLCLSLVLTFAGTFLMLDRSRSFPPQADYAALPGAFEKNRKRKLTWFLEGGIGGLACGYTTGLHLTTFLSLLIPANTTSAPLSSKSFLAVWILVCIVATLVAGRWRYAALGMAGISGGGLASLALSVIIHPSLAPRIILTAIFVPLLTFLVLFFYFVPKFHSRLLHPTLRFCTSANGAFGIILAISLLINPRVDAWANVWERLWLRNGDGWGTGKEKGLSAAYCAFLVSGMAADWALRWWIGECPDEKWDKYLANYMAGLPNQADRAGIFEPSKSFWDRLFVRNDKLDPIIFPPNSDLKATPKSPSLPISPPGGLFNKSRAQSRNDKLRPQHPGSRKRKPVKFGAIDELSSSDEDDDIKNSPLIFPPLSYSSSTPTLVDESPKALRKKHTTDDPAKPLMIDYDAELAELKKLKGTNIDNIPDYSDHEEEDLTSISQRRQSQDHGPWSPAFMQRHSPASSADGGKVLSVPSPGALPVPATPSLIKALDRLAIAQREAFGQSSASLPTPSTSVSGEGEGQGAQKHHTPETRATKPTLKEEELEEEDNARAVANARRERAPRWENFWREVRVKAQT
ncbi:hypothetical protein P691DRAFT_801975 [Macrolepiota fuliginosa MF-IS2]|uniref:DUF4203 domain-containing protein n=1 Tax=Macrolepiota fuliginosa MF-IS2 TaxID=1400762 RepID=A0A9P6C5N8_9AGAR|nr:hypothetical protein P691DRAFT_801975 [Macrolepiota fuliginosa MF-IS2]